MSVSQYYRDKFNLRPLYSPKIYNAASDTNWMQKSVSKIEKKVNGTSCDLRDNMESKFKIVINVFLATDRK